MEITKFLNKYLTIENIDRKKATFSQESQFHTPSTPVPNSIPDIYYDPELFIIKNLDGKILFNEMIKKLRDLDTYKEEGLEYIDDNVNFPFYILQMDWITCGMRIGLWVYYENDISKLSKEILIEELRDDFLNFKNYIKHLFGI